jgi:hypothetical protein
LASSSQTSYVSHPSAGIIGMHHHIWFKSSMSSSTIDATSVPGFRKMKRDNVGKVPGTELVLHPNISPYEQ